jgi:mannosyltransferase OCH1-like enzyme
MVNKDLFQAMRSWAGKADIMRLEILYQHGGLYTDADSIMRKPLQHDCDFILMTSASGYIGNETICAPAGHPALKEAVTNIKGNIERLSQQKTCNLWDIAGATYLTPIFEKYEYVKLPHSVIGPSDKNPTHIEHAYDGTWARGIHKSKPKPFAFWMKQ